MGNTNVVLDDKAQEIMKDVYNLGEGGTTVVANPELSGDEANLTGLQVGNTKYKVSQGSGGNNGYTLSIKNMANNLDLAVGLLQYTELGLEVVDETVSGDNEFHTFNNVFAITYLKYEGYNYQIGNATGIMMGCVIVDGLEAYQKALQLLTNVEMTVSTPSN